MRTDGFDRVPADPQKVLKNCIPCLFSETLRKLGFTGKFMAIAAKCLAEAFTGFPNDVTLAHAQFTGRQGPGRKHMFTTRTFVYHNGWDKFDKVIALRETPYRWRYKEKLLVDSGKRSLLAPYELKEEKWQNDPNKWPDLDFIQIFMQGRRTRGGWGGCIPPYIKGGGDNCANIPPWNPQEYIMYMKDYELRNRAERIGQLLWVFGSSNPSPILW